MPGTSLKKSTSLIPGSYHEEPQQVLLRRVLSTKPLHCTVTTTDGNCLSLMTFDTNHTHSPTPNDADQRSVKLRRTKGKPPVQRPASLDLSSMNCVMHSSPNRSYSQERISSNNRAKRRHLAVFAPNVSQRGGSLRFPKSRKNKDLGHNLVRSATVIGETVKAPIGEYFKESWEAFLTKITERQSILLRQASMACDWLTAAGFPQYSHLYKAGHFPIHISSVKEDHDFLDLDLLITLTKRIRILNKCANLKLDKSLSRDALTDCDNDDYESFALSDRWFSEEDGQGWTRVESKGCSLEGCSNAHEGINFECPSTVQEADDVVASGDNQERASSREKCDESNDVSTSDDYSSKSKGNNFFKKLNSLRKREFLSRKNSGENKSQDDSYERVSTSHKRSGKVTISKPTLQSGREKLESMKCVPVNNCLSIPSEQSTSSSSGCSHLALPTNSSSAVMPSTHSINDKDSSRSKRSGARETQAEKENSLFLVPPSYKPGTFPTVLKQQAEVEDGTAAFSNTSSYSSSRSQSTSDFPHPIIEDGGRKLPRPCSVYDNLDDARDFNLSEELIKILGIDPMGLVDDSGVSSTDSSESHLPGVDVAFWSVDDIVEQTQSLQQMLGNCDDNDDIEKTMSLENNAVEPRFPVASDDARSPSSENVSVAEYESEKSCLTCLDTSSTLQSKWENVKIVPICSSTGKENNYQIEHLSAGQLMMLKRLAVLKLTANMEKFSSKSTNIWSVPRFLRRIKEPDYKDKSVFGVPLLSNIQRFGQPLPPCILHALDHLRRTCLEQMGLFRKPGVRVRIQNLKAKCEDNPNFNDFSEYSAFDVADLVKQFFRELPDPLMTIKLSDTFIGIFLSVSEELRMETIQWTLLLLPDENREALKTLLHFLLDVAAEAGENQMNSSNLSTCFAPSLFHLQINSTKITTSSSPKLRKSQSGKQTSNSGFKPNMKEMNDNNAATQCLIFMMENIEEIFKVPSEASTHFRLSVMEQVDDVLASEIGHKCANRSNDDYYQDFHSYADRVVAATLREEQKLSQSKLGKWQEVVAPPGSEIMSKKIDDGNHLRVWRSRVEIKDADPEQILHRIINEQHLWDDNLMQSEVLQEADERTQLFHSVIEEMPSLPPREYCVLRTWRKEADPNGSVVIVETSTDHPSLHNNVRGVILTSRYVIEPCDTTKNCFLTRYCRVDTKGRNPEWFNKVYGHVVAMRLLKIRDSLRSNICNLPLAS